MGIRKRSSKNVPARNKYPSNTISPPTIESAVASISNRGAVFELTAWSLDGKWRHRRKKSLRVPAYLFNGNYIINFKGVNYRTLNPPEEYLEFCYGDWKVPMRTSDKSLYMTSKHWRSNTILNKTKLSVIKIIKQIYIYLSNFLLIFKK